MKVLAIIILLFAVEMLLRWYRQQAASESGVRALSTPSSAEHVHVIGNKPVMTHIARDDTSLLSWVVRFLVCGGIGLFVL